MISKTRITAALQEVNAQKGSKTPRAEPSLPSAIGSLVEIEEPAVLRRAIDRRVRAGELIEGEGPEDFFISADRCFVFVVTDGRVEAALDTGRVRIDLQTRKPVPNWSERYADDRQIWVATTRE